MAVTGALRATARAARALLERSGLLEPARRLLARAAPDRSSETYFDAHDTPTQPMNSTPRRGRCARCGLTFDAERGYTSLDVLRRAAENPRENSTTDTIRLCDVCSEDFRDFVSLGREETAEAEPDLLRST